MTGRRAWSRMMISGSTKSFHATIKCITPTVPRIGADNGNTMVRNCAK